VTHGTDPKGFSRSIFGSDSMPIALVDGFSSRTHLARLASRCENKIQKICIQKLAPIDIVPVFLASSIVMGGTRDFCGHHAIEIMVR
jgi:hypothetical protein